jgi:hypothetical protein
MKLAPYTLEEAKKLCAEYQYLKDQSFAKDTDAVIECITIAPYDKVSRQRFLIFYFLLNSAESALANEYKGLLYDVLIIARSVADEQELLHEDLNTWLAANKQGAGPHMAECMQERGNNL